MWDAVRAMRGARQSAVRGAMRAIPDPRRSCLTAAGPSQAEDGGAQAPHARRRSSARPARGPHVTLMDSSASPLTFPPTFPAPPRRRAPRALPLASSERSCRSSTKILPSERREAARLRLSPLARVAAARHGPTLAATPAIGRPPPRAAAWAGPRGWLAGGV